MFKTLGIPIVPRVAFSSSNGVYPNILSNLYFIKLGSSELPDIIPAPRSQRFPEICLFPLLNLFIVSKQ